MIIESKRFLAMYCNQCGRLERKELSLWDIKIGSPLVIHCQCGGNLLTIKLTPQRIYKFILDCSLCERTHYFNYELKNILEEQLITLICADSNLDIGYLGEENRVKQAIDEMDQSIVDLAQELNQGDFFNNLDVMHNVLEHLYHLANNGRLCCSCGNQQLDVDFLPDRVELICNHCFAKGIIWAENIQDWQLLSRYKEIKLKEGSYSLLEQLGI